MNEVEMHSPLPHLNLRKAAGWLAALLVLTGLAFVGRAVLRVLPLPLPGPLIGMVLLAAGALLMERLHLSTSRRLMKHLVPVGRLLLSHMGLFFVPAGAGIIATGQITHGEWPCLFVALLGSTLLSLAVTALVMHHLERRKGGSRS